MIAEGKKTTKKRLCDRPSAQDVPGIKILGLSGGLITSFVLKKITESFLFFQKFQKYLPLFFYININIIKLQ